MKCPEEGCKGTIEANPTLYLRVHDDGSVDVAGIGTEDMILTCDDHGHELDPEIYSDFYLTVQFSASSLESFLTTGIDI